MVAEVDRARFYKGSTFLNEAIWMDKEKKQKKIRTTDNMQKTIVEDGGRSTAYKDRPMYDDRFREVDGQLRKYDDRLRKVDSRLWMAKDG